MQAFDLRCYRRLLNISYKKRWEDNINEWTGISKIQIGHLKTRPSGEILTKSHLSCKIMKQTEADLKSCKFCLSFI